MEEQETRTPAGSFGPSRAARSRRGNWAAPTALVLSLLPPLALVALILLSLDLSQTLVVAFFAASTGVALVAFILGVMAIAKASRVGRGVATGVVALVLSVLGAAFFGLGLYFTIATPTSS